MKIFIALASASLLKGDRVAVKFGTNQWYTGTVASVGKKVTVLFDDGEKHAYELGDRSVKYITSKKKSKSALTTAQVQELGQKAGTVAKPATKTVRSLKAIPSRRSSGPGASDDDWLAYWKDENGKYKTKAIESPSDVGELVKSMYKKYNTFFNVAAIRRGDWKRQKSKFI